MIFAIGVFIPIAYIAFSGINDGIQDSDLIASDIKDTMQSQSDGFKNTWDYTFLTIVIAVLIGLLLISYYLNTYPAVFIIFFVLTILFSLVGGFLANAFSDLFLNPILGASLTNFPIINFILSNYLVFTTILFISMLVVFFAKPNEGY